MEMKNISSEINMSLRVLGLEPGATAADVRSAFRRLALTCHPDVAGRAGSVRFQQITSAYALLKGIDPDELADLANPGGRMTQEPEKRGVSSIVDWYFKYRDRAREEAEASRDAVREEERRRREERSRRIDGVLDQYGRSLTRRLESLSKSADEGVVSDIISRLRSSVPAVRRLAVGRVGTLINREDVFSTVVDMMRAWEIDDSSARLVAALPMTAGNRRRMAEELATRASSLPIALIASLLSLRDASAVRDPVLMERYLLYADNAGVSLILRYWPEGAQPGDAVVRRLLDSRDDDTLISLLSAMKRCFPQAAERFVSRISELMDSRTPAVRVWCRALLSASGRERSEA